QTSLATAAERPTARVASLAALFDDPAQHSLLEKVPDADRLDPELDRLVASADSLRASGKYDEARQLYENVQKTIGPNPKHSRAQLGVVLNNLAAILQDLGSYADTKQLYDRTISIQKPLDHNYGTTMANEASLYDAMGMYPNAEVFLAQALAIQQKTLPGRS